MALAVCILELERASDPARDSWLGPGCCKISRQLAINLDHQVIAMGTHQCLALVDFIVTLVGHRLSKFRL